MLKFYLWAGLGPSSLLAPAICNSLCLFLCVSLSYSFSQWHCQRCSHSGYRHPVAAVDLLATCPPPSPASSLITLAYWLSQRHSARELKLGLHQLMTDYSTLGPWEQAGSVGTEGAREHSSSSLSPDCRAGSKQHFVLLAPPAKKDNKLQKV